MKIKSIFCLILIIIINACACNNNTSNNEKNAYDNVKKSEDSSKVSEENHTETVYKLTYYNNSEPVFIPSLSIDEVNKTFVFSYDALSSYLPYGNYEIKDKILTATTSDGKFKYLFEVTDDNTLIFVKEGSSNTNLIDKRLGIEVQDGSVFEVD